MSSAPMGVTSGGIQEKRSTDVDEKTDFISDHQNPSAAYKSRSDDAQSRSSAIAANEVTTPSSG